MTWFKRPLLAPPRQAQPSPAPRLPLERVEFVPLTPPPDYIDKRLAEFIARVQPVDADDLFKNLNYLRSSLIADRHELDIAIATAQRNSNPFKP